MPAQPISRRRLIVTASATACALPFAAACAASGGTAASSGAASSSGGPSSGGSQGPAKPRALAKVSDVPVGSSVSAKTADGKPVLISQPTIGRIVVFSAVCTHMGCTVNPAGKEFHCPCHGSVYDAATGKVLHGPAPRPLPRIPVTVKHKEILPKTT